MYVLCCCVHSWTCFGMVYWAISDNQVQEALRANTTVPEEDRCIYSYEEDLPFTSAFLFSLESQTTIGTLKYQQPLVLPSSSHLYRSAQSPNSLNFIIHVLLLTTTTPFSFFASYLTLCLQSSCNSLQN